MRRNREGARRGRLFHAVVLFDCVLQPIVMVFCVLFDFSEVMPDEVIQDVSSDLI